MRRRLTLKHIDPWSVLKFGFVANLSLLAIWLLGGAVMWFFVRRLRLIEKVCSIATDVGFTSCGVNGGNLFRAMLLLGVLGVVIMTGLAVFFAFLANLITELTGGLSFSFADDTAGAAGRGEVTTASGGRSAVQEAPAHRRGGGGGARSPVGPGWSAPADARARSDTATVQRPNEAGPLDRDGERLFGDRPRDEDPQSQG